MYRCRFDRFLGRLWTSHAYRTCPSYSLCIPIPSPFECPQIRVLVAFIFITVCAAKCPRLIRVIGPRPGKI